MPRACAIGCSSHLIVLWSLHTLGASSLCLVYFPRSRLDPLIMRSFIQFALAFASLFLFVHADFWMGDIAHQGLAPYAGSGYSVFRNVKDYGAVGKWTVKSWGRSL